MSQNVGFGNGSDGVLSVTVDTTDAPVDSSCSGVAGTTSLSATNASFTAGDLILIHQSRGADCGQWEINQIESYVAGTITTSIGLTYTYVDSGADQAQVLVVKEYTTGNIASGKTLTVKTWDGNVGGILAYFFNSTLTIVGTITATEKGFRGGVGSANEGTGGGYSGEGSNLASTQLEDNTGGSGGGTAGGITDAASGGGGGNGTVGANSTSPAVGIGGIVAGVTTLTTMAFGGGGGGSNSNDGGSGGNGGAGGGIILLFAKKIVHTGSIVSSGGSGTNQAPNPAYGGGGGAGGSIFIRSNDVTLGTNLIIASLGGPGAFGGNGGSGRIRVETCTKDTFSTNNPVTSESVGGHTWCGSLVAVV